MNGRETPIQCIGPDAGRRAILKAAAIATGGALVTGRWSWAQHPQASGHATPAQAPAAPRDAAFSGTFVSPSATTVGNERLNIAFLPQAELDHSREAFRVLRAN